MNNRDNAAVIGLANGELSLDDTFRFHCQMCGKCCINREDILLNPQDLYRLAQALGKPPIEIFTEYCEAYWGNTSGMVIVRLRPIGSDKHCPLLAAGRCSVHQSKPTVCALFPLGRGIMMPSDRMEDLSTAKPRYFLQGVTCGDRSEVHTVRDWIEGFGLSAEDRFFLLWSKTAMNYGSLVKQLKDQMSSDVMQLLFAAILGGIYLNYEIGVPFQAQFERNDNAFRRMMKNVGIRMA